MGGVTPRLAVLGSIRKQVEHEEQPMNSTAGGLCVSSASRFQPCVSFCPDFFQWCTVTWKCKLFPPQLLLITHVITAINGNPHQDSLHLAFYSVDLRGTVLWVCRILLQTLHMLLKPKKAIRGLGGAQQQSAVFCHADMTAFKSRHYVLFLQPS